MSRSNAVKFNFLAPKEKVKDIVIISLDHNVSLSYPRLKDAPELVRIKGICLLGDFELFLDDISSKIESFVERLTFIQAVKFKLIEIEQNPVELPTGAEKEETKPKAKK